MEKEVKELEEFISEKHKKCSLMFIQDDLKVYCNLSKFKEEKP